MLGTSQLKTAIVRRLRAQFRTAAVPYIPTTWNTIIQSKPTGNTPYPYICVEIDDNDIVEAAVTAQGSSYDYTVGIKVVTRSEINADIRETRDGMISEIQRILDVDYDEYLNLESKGFNVYIQTVESVNISESNEMGTDFYTGDVMLKVRMEQIGSRTAPVAIIEETYSGFNTAPSNDLYELYDSGTITMPTTYPPSNGWIFNNVAYSLASDSDGTISGNLVTVASGDDLISVVSVITFESALDSSVLTTVFYRQEISAVKSPRISVFTTPAVSDAQISDLSLWTSRFPSVDPNRVEMEITGNTSDFIYIIVDEAYTLTGIKNDLGLDDIEEYLESTQLGFKVYRVDTALTFDNAVFEYTLISGELAGSNGAYSNSGGSSSIGVNIVSTLDASLLTSTVNVIPSGMENLTMSLPSNPTPGDIVYISNLSGKTSNEINLNGHILNGQFSDNLILNDATSSFSLIFINVTYGWNIIGQN